MFTECPECQTAFRVSAQLLRQARGQVQCGDCGHTFDALDHLSEELQEKDSGHSASFNLFDKHSRELLKSLDVLAGGEDVRIEDTGIEWRVLDMDGVNDDDGDAATRQSVTAADFDEADQATSAEDARRDSDNARDTGVGEQLRFDDDSPLPDDYESRAAQGEQRNPALASDNEADNSEAKETLRVSIDTGTEADWRDLLAEVDDTDTDAHRASVDNAADEDTWSDTLDATGEAVFADEFDEPSDEDEEAPVYVPLAAAASTDEDAANSSDGADDTNSARKHDVEQDDEDADDTLVQSITMEGDSVTDVIEIAERASYDDVPPPEFDDEDPRESSSLHRLGRYGMSATLGLFVAAVLGLLLVAQYVHTNRESLATNDVFRQTAAPLYELMGKPLNPAWEIRSWQFEATSGSTDDTDANLTIYSQIANQGSSALPYPLIHLSLTDRWDEVIASRVLQPGQYLASNRNVARPVSAGDSFAALITVAAPAPSATGFKLNVCYPMSGQRLRCAIEDFRD